MLDNGGSGGNRPLPHQLVQAQKISLVFNLFRIPLGVTLKAMVGHMFDTPYLEYTVLVYIPTYAPISIAMCIPL